MAVGTSRAPGFCMLFWGHLFVFYCLSLVVASTMVFAFQLLFKLAFFVVWAGVQTLQAATAPLTLLPVFLLFSVLGFQSVLLCHSLPRQALSLQSGKQSAPSTTL